MVRSLTMHRSPSNQIVTGLTLAFAMLGGTGEQGQSCVHAATYAAGRASDNWQYAADSYGRGVHALFDCRYFEASQLFDESINTGVQDPRPYYFRGLAKLKTGDTFGAESDFEMGATIEATSRGTYDIGMSLIRVQGCERHKLEEIRRRSLAAAMRNKAASDSIYYPDSRATADPGELISPDNLPADVTDPFTDDAEEPKMETVRPAKPTPEKPDAEVDNSNMLDDDPFAAPDDEPGVDFNDSNGLDDDPFGAAAEPGAGFESGNGTDGDPFADPTEPAMDNSPANNGNATPPTNPVDDDPFAATEADDNPF